MVSPLDTCNHEIMVDVFDKKPPQKDKWMNETLQADQIFQKSADVFLKSDGLQSSVRSLKLTAEMWIPSICGWFWKGLFTPDPSCIVAQFA